MAVLFSGGKGFFTEGGLRVPVIARWPGVLPLGITDSTVISLMDFFPTFLSLAGANIPQDRHIDGKDLSQVLIAPGDARDLSGHEILYFYCDNILTAVRFGHYKIYFYDLPFPNDEIVRSRCRGSFPNVYTPIRGCHLVVELNPIQIYNVDTDPRELYLLPVEDHQSMLKKVKDLIKEHETTLVDLPEPLLQRQYRTSKVMPCCNYPYCIC